MTNRDERSMPIDPQELQQRLKKVEEELKTTAMTAAAAEMEEKYDDDSDPFKVAADKGFKARSALGLKFLRDPEGGQSIEYTGSNMSNAEKDAFRRK